jgi:hypothetical protein
MSLNNRVTIEDYETIHRELTKAKELLSDCLKEFEGLPHSLGYSFTHTEKLRAYIKMLEEKGMP